MANPPYGALKVPVLLILLCLLQGCFFEADMDKEKIPGFDFSYLDIERFCTVKRSGTSALKVNCEEPRLRPVSQACSGFITGGLKDTQFNCGGGLWQVKERCRIKMTRVDRGILDCQLEEAGGLLGQ